MIRLEPLTGHRDRNAFDCGVTVLNHWLRRTALAHRSKGISRTFIAVPLDDEVMTTWCGGGYQDIHPASILGFYALASAFVVVETLPSALAKRYPRQIPVTRLGRLATRSNLQGQGLGRLLLADAVNRARGAAQAVGSAGILVDAKGDGAAGFYRHFGFHACRDAPLQLYLPIW